MFKNVLKYTLFIGGAALLTYWAVKDIPYSKIEQTWVECDKTPIWFSGLAVMLSHYFRALRWKLLMKPLGYTFSTLNSFLSIMIGYGLNILVPRGGEVGRCVSLKKLENVPVESSLGTVLSERLVDVIFLIIMIGSAFIVKFDVLLETIQAFRSEHLSDSNSGSTDFPYFTSLIILVSLIGSIIILKSKNPKIIGFRKKVTSFLIGMKEGVISIFKLENSPLFILYSILIWVLYYLMAYIVIQAFEKTSVLGLEGALMVLVLGSIAMAMPMPGGTGTYQVFVPFGLKYIYKIPQLIGTPFAIIFHAWQTIIHLLTGGVAFLISEIILRYGNSKKSSK